MAFKLNVSPSEWAAAKQFFSQNPLATKLKKNNINRHHSFIKINNVIYAMANRARENILGKGGFGLVKIAQTEQGMNYAVKIEGRKKNASDIAEEKINALIHFSHGMLERNSNVPKIFWKNDPQRAPYYTYSKLYKIFDLAEGRDLFDEIHHRSVPLTQVQKLIIGIKCCQALQKLHQLRIIHADIKPQNIMVKVEGNKVVVTIIDFGLSFILPQGFNSYPGPYMGTPGYMAPEIVNGNPPTFSFKSDIYALGVTLSNLGLPPEIYRGLRDKRESLTTTMNNLANLLEKCPNLDSEARKVIEEIKGPAKRPQQPQFKAPAVVQKPPQPKVQVQPPKAQVQPPKAQVQPKVVLPPQPKAQVQPKVQVFQFNGHVLQFKGQPLKVHVQPKVQPVPQKFKWH